MKLRHLISTAVVVISVLIAAVSCKKTAPDHIRLIPSNAMFVGSFNANALLTKSELLTSDKNRTARIIKEMTRHMEDESKETFSKIIKDPSESGIALEHDIFFFVVPVEQAEREYDEDEYYHPRQSDNFNVGMTGAIADIAKFEKMLKPILDEARNVTVQEKEGYKLISNGREFSLSYDKNRVLMLIANHNNEEIVGYSNKLMAQTLEQSIASNKGFQKQANQKKDMNFIFSYKTLKSLDGFSEMWAGMGYGESMNLDETYLIGSCSFEKGKSQMDFEMFSTDPNTLKEWAKAEKAMKNLGSNHHEYFSNKTLAFMLIPMVGDYFWEMLTKHAYFKEMIDESKKSDIPFDIERLVRSFNGYITMGTENISGFRGMPKFNIYANVKDNYIVEVVRMAAQEIGGNIGSNVQEYETNQFHVTDNEYVNVYFGVKNNTLYIVSGIDSPDKIFEKASSKIAGSNAAPSLSNKTKSYFSINVDALFRDPTIRSLISFMGHEGASMLSVMSFMSSIEITSDNQQGGSLIIHGVVKDENMLKVLTDSAFKFM